LCAGYSVAGLVILPTVALLLGAAVYGWNPARTPQGERIRHGTVCSGWPLWTSISRSRSYWWPAPHSGCRRDRCAAGRGRRAVAIVIVSNILDSITALHGWRSLLPTHYQFSGSMRSRYRDVCVHG